MDDRQKKSVTTRFEQTKENNKKFEIEDFSEDFDAFNEKESLVEEVNALTGRNCSELSIEMLSEIKDAAIRFVLEHKGDFLESISNDSAVSLETLIAFNGCSELEEKEKLKSKQQRKITKEKTQDLTWNKNYDIIKDVECPGVIIDIDVPANSTVREFLDELIGMYAQYAYDSRVKFDLIEDSPKKLLINIEGEKAFSMFKYERGMHCIKTNSEKTDLMISVLPKKAPSDYTVKINDSDLKFETYRSGGAGGQHVNKTSSAVRVTHIPTGIVVACQAERSQFQNKAKALEMLQNKLEAMAEEKRLSEMTLNRLEGYSNQKIRTYDLNSNTLTDYRINFKTGIEQGISKFNMEKLISKLDAASIGKTAEKEEIR